MAASLFVVVVLVGELGLCSVTAPRAETNETPAFTGSESCSVCHADQVADWRDSHHGWALRNPHRENNPQGRAEFPTLPKAAYDSPQHHKHPPGSAGARCISCHMPVKTYVVVDPRAHHSFRVPRPDLSDKVGTPNVCSGCHTDKSAGRAAKTVKAWYPQRRWRELHYGEVLHAGRTRGYPETTKALMTLSATESSLLKATGAYCISVEVKSRYSEHTLELAKPIPPKWTLRVYITGTHQIFPSLVILSEEPVG